MDFEFDDDQRELQDTVHGIVAKECSPAFVRSVLDAGVDPTPWWDTMVELGWPALAIPEAHGGLGLGWVELAIVLELLGQHADPSPFLATTAQFAPAVLRCGTPDQADRWLGAVAAGELIGTLADGAGTVTAIPATDGWLLDGSVTGVIDADRADAIAVIADLPGEGPAVFVIERPTDGLDVVPIPAFDHLVHVADVKLTAAAVPADARLTGPAANEGIAAARHEAALAWSLSTLGACQRVFDMTLDYVKQRQQFGVPIGSFQAVKHKLADMYVLLERARAVCQFAARLVADDTPQAPLAVAAAKTAAGDCQLKVFRDGLQLFGGIGHTWENDVQIFVRRAKLGALLWGRTSDHCADVARVVLANPEAAAVSLTWTPDVQAMRAEFEAWLDQHVPSPDDAHPRPGSTADLPPWARTFQNGMFEAGWLLPGQPPEFGGRNASLLEQFAIAEVHSERKIYHSYNPQGVGIIAPSILIFGTPEQKQRWAVPLLRGEITAALGMSEPNAGSDLAGLRTKAVLDGDEYVVNGQKVWTSGAHDADFILAFVRTDPDAPKHKGISCLIIPTDTPGVTRRPFPGINGHHELDFNEVFFDDARVPAENLVGPLNQGWAVANGALGEERAMLWLGQYESLDYIVHRFAARAEGTPHADDPLVHAWYGRLVTDAIALRVLGFRAVLAAARGRDTAAQSILKLFGSEAVQRALESAVESLGAEALDREQEIGPFNPLGIDEQRNAWFERYIRSFATTIAGGTSEIQRNIISERVLGLPR